NLDGTKLITRNIIFFGYGFGIHAYTEGGSIEGFDIVENVWFRTGAAVAGSSTEGTSDGCLTGGLQPLRRARLIDNLGWGPTMDARSARIGWSGSVTNESITITGNSFGGLFAVQGQWSGEHVIQDNEFFALSGLDPADWPDNEYRTELPTS